MIDPKLLRQSPEDVKFNLARRGFTFDVEGYTALEAKRKELQVDTESLRSERNSSAKQIGKAKAQGDDVEPLLAAVKELGNKLDASESQLQAIQVELRDVEMGLPNLVNDDVPDGGGEADNRELRRWGEVPEFDFEPADHVDLGTGLGLLDFDAASRISGSRFISYRVKF